MKPPVALILCHLGQQVAPAHYAPVYNALQGVPAYFLVNWYWTIENDNGRAMLRARAAYEDAIRADFPHHVFVHLAKTPGELEALGSAGLLGLFCNQNCFVDERIYRPFSAERRFDAVYDATLLPYKRHFLAREVENLALVYDAPDASDVGMFDLVRTFLPQATFVNHQTGRWRLLSSQEINMVNNVAGCGLCLSKAEGAMFASMQYLLAGIPVVSTPSAGGRDVFFDDASAVIVDPSPSEIRLGVRAALDLNEAKSDIRARTLQKVWQHRARLTGLLNWLRASTDQPAFRLSEWQSAFVDKLLRWERADDTVTYLASLGGCNTEAWVSSAPTRNEVADWLAAAT